MKQLSELELSEEDLNKVSAGIVMTGGGPGGDSDWRKYNSSSEVFPDTK